MSVEVRDIGSFLSLKKILRKVFLPFILLVQVIWALLVLFVEWGWHPLSEIFIRFTRFAWVARLEQKIENLSPYPALFIFFIPLGLLFPLKLFALWMLVHGYLALALCVVLFAKVLTTAVLARTFKLTREKILHIRWFAIFHDRFILWKNQIFLALRNSMVWQYGRYIRGFVQLWVRDFQVWMKAMF